MLKSWVFVAGGLKREKFIVVDEDSFRFYEGDNMKQLTKTIHFDTIRDVVATERDFTLYTNYRQYHIQFSSCEESMNWCEHLNRSIEKVKYGSGEKNFKSNRKNNSKETSVKEISTNNRSKRGGKQKNSKYLEYDNDGIDEFEKVRYNLMEAQKELEKSTNQLKDSEHKLVISGDHLEDIDVLKKHMVSIGRMVIRNNGGHIRDMNLPHFKVKNDKENI